MQPLETARLRLRHLQLDDAAFILELLNDPCWLRYIGDKNVHSLDDARDYLSKGPIGSYRRLGFGLYCVELRDTATPIGLCGLIKRDALPDIDIGFALLPAHFGHGYVLEASRAMIDQGRREFVLKRLLAITSPDNAASISVIRKLGLQPQGSIAVDGSASPTLLFAIDYA
jgi:RimJ/RimL family protein N-acetyltransferase